MDKEMKTAIVIEVTTGRLSEVATSQLTWGTTTNLDEDSEMRRKLELKESPEFCILELPCGDVTWVEPIYPDAVVGEC
jgi:hypothetical protein